MKALVLGSFSFVFLLAFYGLVMTTLTSWEATVLQFKSLWYLMLPLALGFGVQIGLFTKIKIAQTVNKGCVAASGTTSTIGMLACCSHHVTDLLPFIGLSAVGLFLSKYQIPILLVSLFVNLLGIVVMIKTLRRLP